MIESNTTGQENVHHRNAPQGKRVGPDSGDSTLSPVLSTPHNKDNLNHTDGLEDWKILQKSLLEGVVDLTDTVETHRRTKWAPGTLSSRCRSYSCFTPRSDKFVFVLT